MALSVAASTTPAIETVADLLEQLGGITPGRVRLRPALGTATEQDVLELHDREGRLYELLDGVLVEKAMGLRESYLAIVLSAILSHFVQLRNLGIVTGEAGMMRLMAGLVRIPDVAFISWERLPNRRIPTEPLPDVVPDLAVEVLSASNTRREMERKVQEYCTAGVSLVWLVDPQTRTVAVYTAPENPTILLELHLLDGGTVLPGFALSLHEFFGALDRQG